MVSEADILGAAILVVDDKEANLLLLERILQSAGYTSISKTMDSPAVFELHRKYRYDLILLDLRMPVMDGFQVMENLKVLEGDGYLPVLVITAEPSEKLHALQAGAKDFVSKPFELAEVEARVHNMIEVRLLQKETLARGAALDSLIVNLQTLVKEQVQEISEAHLATILALSQLAEARDVDTGRHLERTMAYCRSIASSLRRMPRYAARIDDAFIEDLYYASPLHDIGKVAISDAILLKPGRLSEEEFMIMKTHAARGADTLQVVHERYPRNSLIEMGIQVARSHHEKWNGEGYPDGLAGDDIPLSAQIMALADAYDAMRSRRCYKEPYTHARAKEIILSEKGRQFNPDLVENFVEREQEFERIHGALR